MDNVLNVPDFMTVQEFIVWDAPWGARWQLVDGAPTAMAPASETHSTILAEVGRLIGNHLAQSRPGCRVLTAPGVVPRVGADSNFRIPDLGVTCDPPRRDSPYTVAPVLLVEVLSPSNRSETWGNIWTYTTIPSVRDILIIDSTAISVRLLRRNQDGTWPEVAEAFTGGALTLESIGCTLSVPDLYAGTWLTAPPAG
jgi:Uma2 family endonuclease